MPSRSAKLRQYVLHANRYIGTCPPVIKSMALTQTERTLDQNLAAMSLDATSARRQLLKETLSRAIIEIQNIDRDHLSDSTKDIVLAFLQPMIAPNSVDNSPTRQGAEIAVDSPLPPSHPTATPVVLNDDELLDATAQVFVPIMENVAPKALVDAAKSAGPLVRKFLPREKTKRSLSRASQPEKKRAFKPDIPAMDLSRASPQVELVAAVTKSLSWSDVSTDIQFVEDMKPGLEQDETVSGKRLSYWRLHGHHCVICSWIARFCFSGLGYDATLSAQDRQAILSMHVWGFCSDKLEYSGVTAGMYELGVFVDNKVNVLALTDFIKRNK